MCLCCAFIPLSRREVECCQALASYVAPPCDVFFFTTNHERTGTQTTVSEFMDPFLLFSLTKLL
jgi:hypothetical protein